MRKTAITLFALGLVALMAAPALSATFWTEPFTYADGGLVANSGGNWVGHSTATNYTDIQVASGEAILVGANGQDDSRNFTEQSASAVTYACFKMKIVGAGTSGTVYFAHFKNTGTFFCARVFAIATGATTYQLGINSSSATPTGTSLWPNTLSKDTYYTIAIKYDATSGLSTLWVDPVDALSPSVTGAVASVGTLVSGFALRQSSFAGGNVYVDDISVGDTFQCATVVPTNGTTWGRIKSIYR